LFCGAGCSDSGGLAISGKAGTLGFGGELTTGITSNVNARVGLNTLDFDYDDEFDNVEYDVGLDFSSFSALVDWYLFDNSFRITGGILSLDHKLDLDATGAPGELAGIGDGDYDWADIGTLSGSADVDGIAPYIGIGWGDPMDRSKRWGFYCDFGVAFTDSPDVALSATGAAAGLAEDLAKERDEIENDLEPFEFYPVLSLGIFFRF
jgi:hypothetical protein